MWTYTQPEQVLGDASHCRAPRVVVIFAFRTSRHPGVAVRLLVDHPLCTKTRRGIKYRDGIVHGVTAEQRGASLAAQCKHERCHDNTPRPQCSVIANDGPVLVP